MSGAATKGVKSATNGNGNGNGNGSGETFLTAAQILAAPPDCREEVMDVPEWGGQIKLRSPTALAAAAIKSAMMVVDAEEETMSMDMAAAERAQILHGVVEPALTPADVEAMQTRFGPVWQRVIAKLDEISGPLGKPGEKVDEATFPEAG